MERKLPGELGYGMKRLGPVGRVVHEYIGSATILLALEGYQTRESAAACGREGDIYAFREYKFYVKDVICDAIEAHQNELALQCIRIYDPSVALSVIEPVSHAIAKSQNLGFIEAMVKWSLYGLSTRVYGCSLYEICVTPDREFVRKYLLADIGRPKHIALYCLNSRQRATVLRVAGDVLTKEEFAKVFPGG